MDGTPRPFTVADQDRLQWVMQGSVSPDGRSFCYELARLDVTTDTDRMDLWILDLATGASRQLTQQPGSQFRAAWSPDSTRLAFLSTHPGAPQIFIIDVGGGEARQLTDLPTGVHGAPAWSPDGTLIAANAAFAAPRDARAPYRVTRGIPRLDDVSDIGGQVQDIFVVTTGGGDVTQLTSDGSFNVGPTWSPDGRELLFLSALAPDALHPFSRPRIVDLDGVIRDVVGDSEHDLSVTAVCWVGDQVAVLGVRRDQPIGGTAHIWLTDRNGEQWRDLSSTIPATACIAGLMQSDMPPMATYMWPRLVATPDGNAVLASVQIGGQVAIHEFPIDIGAPSRPLVTGERAAYIYGAGEHQLVYICTDFFEPGDIYVADRDGEGERRLTAVNADTLRSHPAPRIETFTARSCDGTEIEAWFAHPIAGEAPYPTVLVVHGGPWAAFGHVFSLDLLMLTSAGFGVLFANHRGSTGYGDAFAQAMDGGHWGELDFADLLAAVDTAISLGLADADHLGITGGSAGGYHTMWAVTQTHRFKAAVAEAGIANWLDMYALSDARSSWSMVMGKHPHEDPDLWLRSSPIMHAHKCTTPTLLVHGENDHRVPIAQSESFYTYLKVAECPVELLRIPGAAHATTIGLGNPSTRRARDQAVLDWMTAHVLGENS